ncbi:hypothetical protein ACX9I7_06720 [Streptomyces sp. L500]|uniref:hypothetical protein n=1 Tax=Streptomyces abikoensis TaxID=97398 RepID=UPI0036C791A3
MVNGTAVRRPRQALCVAALATAVLAGSAGCSGSSSDEGKELRFGETASLPGYKDAKVDVTVERLEQGGSADLSVLKDASKYAGRTPYYLRYKLTKPTGAEAGKSGGASTYFSVADANKKRLTKLTILGALDTTGDPKNPLKYRGFEKCESLSTSDFEKAAPGQSVTGCAVYVADAGAGAPTGVTWEQGTKTLATWK